MEFLQLRFQFENVQIDFKDFGNSIIIQDFLDNRSELYLITIEKKKYKYLYTFRKIIRSRNECLEEPTPSTVLVRWKRRGTVDP